MISPLRAMQRSVRAGAFVFTLLAIAGIYACAPDSITRSMPAGGLTAPPGSSHNVTPVEPRVLKVCTGDGPTGTYTYQLSNLILGAGSRGTITTPLGTTFDVPSGTCVDAVVLTFPYLTGETDQVTSITVTEIARPAGTTFKYVQSTQLVVVSQDKVCLAPANFPCGQDKQVFVPNPTIVINEYHGSILAFFHNSASLGDFVWSDTNGNGIQDVGEAGIAGVTVSLSGAVSATTVTGANGEYAFTGLPAGTYSVSLATPVGTTPSPVSAAGSTPINDSNASGGSVTLAAAESNTTIDFGFVPPRFVLGDRVWSDTNGDGVQDSGEPGLNGVTVTITGPNGFTGTTTTAGDGIYAFNNLLAGKYTVCTTAGVPTDATQTYDLDGIATPNCAAITVGPSTTDVDFGYKPARFSLGDRVWSDVNGNGTQEAGEAGLSAVTVSITGPGGYSATTTTGANGVYGFGNLLAGSYTVCTTAGVPADYTQTYDLDGTNSANCATAVLTSASRDDVDFGYTPPRFAIGDRVWNDVNANTLQDVGETGINGVTVTISGTGGYTASATTAVDGNYAFAGLLAGTYTVCTTVGIPAGYTQTYDLDGTNTPNCTIVAVGPSTTLVDFGYTPARFSVGDRVWYDLNGNGVQDAGEIGITGVTVKITNTDGYTATTTTGADGIYSFPNLLTGTYTVCTTAGVPASYTQTYDLDGISTANCATLGVGPTTNLVDFGYTAPRYSVGDRVWNDVNGDGVQDAGEAGLTGVIVTIGGAGGFSASTTTAADGLYTFDNLLAGSYTVCTTTGIPAGYTQTYDLDGTGTANCATVSVGPTTVLVDFGYKAPPRFSVGDRVWSDVNGNGVQDAGETGIAGVTVTIAGPGGYTSTMTTAADGLYSFPNLLAGSYTVCTTAGVPAGDTQTYDLDGLASANCAAVVLTTASRTDVDFGYTAPPPPTATCVVINAVAGSAIVPVTVVGSGGAGGPYTFTASGLPSGLAMSSAGVISGTATVSGTFTYSVTVTDKSGKSGTVNCSLAIKPAPSASCISITAVQGVAITPVTLVGTGGSGGPYTFTVSFLPAGLVLSTTGVLSGTSQVNGQFTYAITIRDKDGHVGTFSCTLQINPPAGTGFTTYTQGGWGSSPRGNNPGQLLTTNFSLVFPSGSVIVGGTKTLTFTSAAAVIGFLPQGSIPGALAVSATNATTSAAGVFAGQVLALRLSVDFSNAGITRSGLGGMHLTSGKLIGKTVSEVLAIANTVLGGTLSALPVGVSVSDLNGVVDTINNNFDGGTTNNGYVAP